MTVDNVAVTLTLDSLPWQSIYKAPHDTWLLVRGSSGRRDGIKRYLAARFESKRSGVWGQKFRDADGNAVTDGGPMVSEFVELFTKGEG